MEDKKGGWPRNYKETSRLAHFGLAFHRRSPKEFEPHSTCLLSARDISHPSGRGHTLQRRSSLSSLFSSPSLLPTASTLSFASYSPGSVTLWSALAHDPPSNYRVRITADIGIWQTSAQHQVHADKFRRHPSSNARTRASPCCVSNALGSCHFSNVALKQEFRGLFPHGPVSTPAKALEAFSAKSRFCFPQP